MSILPVVLCGGSGTRLWPLSRSAYAKQFLALNGDRSLLQQTLTRVTGMADVLPPLVVSNVEQRFLVAEQLRELGADSHGIILEPAARNTAPAVAAAALVALQQDPAVQILVLPSDHVITQPERFRQLVGVASQVAATGRLVTFGITPTMPHTGYGYIQRGAALPQGGYAVDAFVEKPTAERAAALLAAGGYYWNSGMFLFPAQLYLDELRRVQPAMVAAMEAAVAAATRDLDFLRLDSASFAASPSESIDYAVMEHTQLAAVVEAADLGWNDIGSWRALAEVAPADDAGNHTLGDVYLEGVANSYARAESRLVAAIGLSDVVVVETADAVLVAHKDRTQDVKKIVDRLNAEGRSETVFHRRVYRPWGSYEGVDQGERFQVKRIVVNPGATLSLQMHYHRAEHWIVVKGTAKVVNGEQEILLTENQSTYIPLGVVHRLENPGRVPLELIEVQSGSYLGEDDIVRFQDNYGRIA